MTGNRPFIEISVDEAINRLRNLRERDIPEFSKAYLRQMALEVLKIMKIEANIDTGRMRSSIDIFTFPGGVEIGPCVDYAPYVALGTGKYSGNPFHATAMDAAMARQPTIVDALLEQYIGGSVG